MLVPPARMLFDKVPFIENFVDNLALVQFNHRLFAYLVVLVALAHAVQAVRMAPGAAAGRAMGVAALTLAQMGLGIVTLLLQVPLWAGLAHQVFAMAVLIDRAVPARRLRRAVRCAVPGPSPRHGAEQGGPARRSGADQAP